MRISTWRFVSENELLYVFMLHADSNNSAISIIHTIFNAMSAKWCQYAITWAIHSPSTYCTFRYKLPKLRWRITWFAYRTNLAMYAMKGLCKLRHPGFSNVASAKTAFFFCKLYLFRRCRVSVDKLYWIKFDQLSRWYLSYCSAIRRKFQPKIFILRLFYFFNLFEPDFS